MFRNTELGKIAGIDVRIHWTFWMLMLFYVLSSALSGGLLSGVMVGLTFALVFLCVVAHEFGHAFAARAFGIPTHDITLLPIGGLARLARMPDKPSQELIIALAGPAVNVVIVMGLMCFLPLRKLVELSQNPVLVLGDSLFENLLVANVVLVLFNLLPAFPMDGGRVLRSLIAMGTTHLRATEIAVRVGRWMAVAFVLLGLLYFGSISLVLVGLFVFLAGTSELMQARQKAVAQHQANWFTWPQEPITAQVVDATDFRRL